METQQKLVIGLFGFGVVGEGIYRVLQQTPSLSASIRRVCIRDSSKPRNAPASLFTTDSEALLGDPEINVIVELIDDADEALRIVTTALKQRKAVVSANKKMIAHHFSLLLSLQQEYGTPFLYEGAVGGSIPIIRNLEEYYDNDLLQSICGIVNGSTNFILTRLQEGGGSYRQALLEAQQAGFAESDPSLDVEGFDAANKLSILLLHTYGIVANPDELLRFGIDRIHRQDVVRAGEKGWQIKLVARATKLSNGRIASFVLPHFVEAESQLHAVREEYNGIVIQSLFSDKQFLYGKGAGRFPTASAVLSDISALRYGYRYEYRKWKGRAVPELTDDFYLRVHLSFDDWDTVDRSDFLEIEEFHSQKERQYLTGKIHYRKLLQAGWFQKRTASVILYPDGIIEPEVIHYRRLKDKSLELAGTSAALNPVLQADAIITAERAVSAEAVS